MTGLQGPWPGFSQFNCQREQDKTSSPEDSHLKEHPQQLQHALEGRSKHPVQSESPHVKVWRLTLAAGHRSGIESAWKCWVLWLTVVSHVPGHHGLEPVHQTRISSHMESATSDTVYQWGLTFKFFASFFFSVQTDIPGLPTLQMAPRKHHQIFRTSKT